MDEIFGQIREYVENRLQNHGAHGLDHTLRVTRLCEIIGEEENADRRILIPAAMLHDIARPIEEETGAPHEEEGAKIAELLLISLGYPDKQIPAITHAIRTHRYRSENKPLTLEAKILSDADKLDAIGTVGIARAFMSAGEKNGDIQDAIDHIYDKLLKLSEMMYTDSARNIASDRHISLQNFVNTLNEELNTGY